MIEIKITKTITQEYKANEQFVVDEEPVAGTNIEEKYSNEKKPAYKRSFDVREVLKYRDIVIDLHKQQIEKDEDFKLVEVIKAINNIKDKKDHPLISVQKAPVFGTLHTPINFDYNWDTQVVTYDKQYQIRVEDLIRIFIEKGTNISHKNVMR